MPIADDQAKHQPDTSPPSDFGDLASSALAYWEPRRVVYNLILAGTVLWQVGARWDELGKPASVEMILPLFILAVIANAFYSLAYLPDVFVQLSRFRPLWLRWRWALWLTGTGFATALTYLIIHNTGPE